MKDELRQILIPSGLQVLVCNTLSLILIVSLYFQAIFNRFNVTSVEPPNLQESLTTQLTRLNEIAAVRTGVIVLFWSIVGLVAYVAYITIANAVIEARNEVVIEMEYTNRGHGPNRFRGIALQIMFGLGLIVVLILSSLWGLPLWFDLVSNFLIGSLTLQTTLSAILGVAGLAANLYVIWTLGQIVHVADQL